MNFKLRIFLLSIPFLLGLVIAIAWKLGAIQSSEAFGPLCTVLSIGTGVFIASENLRSNQRLHMQKLSFDILEKDYPIRNAAYASAIDKLSNERALFRKPSSELSFDELNASIEKLSAEEHSKIKELLNYYSVIARGVQLRIFDENTCLTSLSGSHIVTWLDCWPVVLWHRKLDERIRGSYQIKHVSGVTPMYYYLERWIEQQIGSQAMFPPLSGPGAYASIGLSKNTV